MRARLLHGSVMSHLTSTPIVIGYNPTYKVYVGKYWSEVIVEYKSLVDYWDNLHVSNIIKCIVESNNPRIATLVAQRLLDIQWGDDCIYALFERGRLHRYIRLDFPPWFLERYDPRKHFDELSEKAILYYHTKNENVSFDDLIEDILYYDFSAIPRVKEFVDFAKYVGDDLLLHIIKHKLNVLIEKECDPKIIKILHDLKPY